MRNKLRKFYCLKELQTVVLWMLLLCLNATVAWAQQRTIKGTVVDETGEPAIGATVIVKGTNSMTITDLDGQFQLSIPNDAKTMEISYVGYETAVIALSGKAIFNVKLKVADLALDEVVVIGYGTAKRGSVTNAISTINSENIEDRSNENVLSTMQGQLAGVQIMTSSGTPGGDMEIHIRGAASINASDEPLYVVDGIPVEDLSSLNPDDIGSIDVLKDASSSAIYGSRGANGVILIQTKTPEKSDKVTVQFSASYSLQHMERKLDVLTPEEWIEWRSGIINRAYVAAYGAAGATAEDDYDTRLKYRTFSSTYFNDPRWYTEDHAGIMLIDWQDAAFRTAPKQTYNLSFSGNTGKTSYRASLGYVDQKGIALNTGYKRLNMRVNMQTTIFDKLTVGVKIDPSMSWTNGGSPTARNVLSMVPIAEEEAGLYTGAQPYESYAWASSAVSPVASLEWSSITTEDTRLNTSAFLRYDILKGWRVEVTGSYNYRDTQYRSFVPSSLNSRWSINTVGYYTTANRRDTRKHNYLLQAVTNYDRTFKGKHAVSAMAGWSLESSTGYNSRLVGEHFPDNEIQDFNQDDETITTAYATTDIPVRLISLFGRAQYEYDNRYLVTFSLRRDGSSKFGSNKRWGLFPAVSAAYRISNESFWPENFVVNSMKLRGSWGANGNNRIDSGSAVGQMGSSNYSLNNSLVNGFAPTSIDNPDLTWEKVYSWDIGMDFSLFKNRISVSLDYYQKKTKDLLYEMVVPAVSGYSTMWDNVGEVQNKGFEIELQTRNLQGPLTWNTSFNLSYNTNKVTDLGSNGTIYDSYGIQCLQVGQPMNSFYMYDAVGVYQYAEDLLKYPVLTGSELGNIRFRDVNDDGKINESDQTLVGKPNPDYTLGLTNKFTYKDFDLSFLFTAQFGGSLYSRDPGRYMDNPSMTGTGNVFSWWQNMWVSEEQPGDGKTPKLSENNADLYNTRWLYSSDYIRLKNITLGYKIPISRKIAKNARVYVSIENVWLWDKYDGGYSPENRGSNAYPQARVYTIGANFTF